MSSDANRAAVYEKAKMVEDNRYGFGDNPAIVAIDLQNGETDPEHPMGSDLSDVIANTNKLVDIAHEKDVPVIWVRVVFSHPDAEDASLWTEKIPAIKNWKRGSYWVEFDDRCKIEDTDFVVEKQHASCFAGTELNSILTSQGVDTVLICGCSTSACVRATADDASYHGYRPIVPEEAVGDRSSEQHAAHLWDLDRKFADVELLETVSAYLQDR